MTDDEFRQIVSQDSALAGPLKRAAAADSQQFILGVGEAAALVFMFPIAQFVLTQICLPWLYEAKRYSETRFNVALALATAGRLADAWPTPRPRGATTRPMATARRTTYSRRRA